MKIQIETRKPDPVQSFFSAPLSFAQRVTVKKLLITEKLLERMQALGLNRKQLASNMEVSPARITTMMDGTNNFTLETLMRAAEAVDADVELAIVPKDHQVRWSLWKQDDVHTSFVPCCQPVKRRETRFALSEPSREDEAHAA